MRKNFTISLIIFFFINSFIYFEAKAKISTKIIVKVGDSIITSVDLQNEIMTNLHLKKLELTQVNIDKTKNLSIQSLIKSSIKRIEVNKYDLKNFNKTDLNNYIIAIAKIFDTSPLGLKQVFKNLSIDYDVFVEKYKTELLWNTLIYQKFKNQININIIEVETEIEILGKDKSENEIKEIKKKLLKKKKETKLDLFSRSHFSTLESSIPINFQ